YQVDENDGIEVTAVRQIINAVSSKLMLFGLKNDVVHLMLLGHKFSDVGDDVAGVDCLSNEEIFAELGRMGYEKSSTKLTFYKAFFSAQWNLVRNVDSPSKFLMYLRFLQLMINAQVDDLSSHYTKYTSPTLTQKVFANIRRIGTGFSRVDTPLFDEHIPSPPQAKSAQPSSPPQQQPSQTVGISMTLLNQLMETCATLTKRLKKAKAKGQEVGKEETIQIFRLKEIEEGWDNVDEDVNAKVAMDANVQGRLAESQAKVYHMDLEHAKKVLSMQDTDEAEPTEVEEVIEVVTSTKLMIEVVTTAATTITDAQVPKANSPRRIKGVVIKDPEETATASVTMHSEVKSNDKGKGILIKEPKPLKRQAQIKQDEAFARQMEAELNANINWNDVVDQIKRKEKQDNTVMRYQALKRKPITEAQARKNMMVYLKNIAGFKMDFFRGMTYNEIRPIFEKHYNLNQAFLERVKKEVTCQKEEGCKRKGSSLNQNTAKKQRIDEQKEVLKAHLQIVVNDDDDVFTKSTSLALKGLEVEEESEVSLELLRFVRRQQQEGYKPNFGFDAVEDFKEYILRDYYCWLKTYCCWYKLKLLDNAADSS
nr:hypothetical protein [Tanacetum cinerariifolium]